MSHPIQIILTRQLAGYLQAGSYFFLSIQTGHSSLLQRAG